MSACLKVCKCAKLKFELIYINIYSYIYAYRETLGGMPDYVYICTCDSNKYIFKYNAKIISTHIDPCLEHSASAFLSRFELGSSKTIDRKARLLKIGAFMTAHSSRAVGVPTAPRAHHARLRYMPNTLAKGAFYEHALALIRARFRELEVDVYLSLKKDRFWLQKHQARTVFPLPHDRNMQNYNVFYMRSHQACPASVFRRRYELCSLRERAPRGQFDLENWSILTKFWDLFF